MVPFYVDKIHKNEMTIEEVPFLWRKAVREILMKEQSEENTEANETISYENSSDENVENSGEEVLDDTMSEKVNEE